MPDWLIVVLFVAGHWSYQAWSESRRRAGRTVPSMFPLVVASIAVGAAIGEWWVLLLALTGLPGGIVLNWKRNRLRVHEAVFGTAVEAAIIALGCGLSRLL